MPQRRHCWIGLFFILLLNGCGGGGGGSVSAPVTGVTPPPTVQTSPRITVQGTFYLAAPEQTVTTAPVTRAPSRAPLAGAEVFLAGDPVPYTMTDSSGRYRFQVNPAEYRRKVSTRADAPPENKLVVLARKETNLARLEVNLETVTVDGGKVIEVKPGEPGSTGDNIARPASSLLLHVQEKGQGVNGAEVRMLDLVSGTVVEAGRCGNSGQLNLTQVIPGEYVLVVHARDGQEHRRNIRCESGKKTTLDWDLTPEPETGEPAPPIIFCRIGNQQLARFNASPNQPVKMIVRAEDPDGDLVSIHGPAGSGSDGTGPLLADSSGTTFLETTVQLQSSSAGSHTYRYTARDRQGNTAVVSFTLNIVSTSLTCSVRINNGDERTGSRQVTLQLTATESARFVSIADENGNWSIWQAYRESIPWTLTGPEGIRTVSVRLQDQAGLISEPLSDTIRLEFTPPTGTVSINDDAETTDIQQVFLRLNCPSAVQFRFSLDDGPWSAWEPYQELRSGILLASGIGTHQIRVIFRTEESLESPIAQDEILMIEPNSQSAGTDHEPQIRCLLNGTGTAEVTIPWGGILSLQVQAEDVDGNLVLLKGPASGNADFPVTPLAEATGQERLEATVSLAPLLPGDWQYRFMAIDDTEKSVSCMLLLHVTPPPLTAAMVINQGAGSTAQREIELNISASAQARWVSIAGENGQWTEWQPYASTIPWTLAGPNGIQSVTIRIRDGFGQISLPLTDSIRLALPPPEGTITLIDDDGTLHIRQGEFRITLTTDRPVPAEVSLHHGNGTWSGWLPYQPTISRTLPVQEGTCQTWLKMRTADGLESVPVSCEYRVIYPPEQPHASDIKPTGLTLTWKSLPCDSTQVLKDGRPVLSITPQTSSQTVFTANLGAAEGIIAGERYRFTVTRSVQGLESPASPATQVEIPRPVPLPDPNQPPRLHCLRNGEQTTEITIDPGLDLPLQIHAEDDDGQWIRILGPIGPDTHTDAPLLDEINGANRLDTTTLLPASTPGDHEFTFLAVDDDGDTGETRLILHVIQPPPGGTMVINQDAETTDSRNVQLNLTTDTASQISIAGEDGIWSDWHPFRSTIPWTLSGSNGEVRVSARLRDADGRTSPILTDSIRLELPRPVGSVAINGGAPEAGNTAAFLKLTCPEAVQFKYAFDQDNWSPWQPMSPLPLAVRLPDGEGSHEVSVIFMDGEQTESLPAWDDILLVTTPPEGTIHLQDSDNRLHGPQALFTISLAPGSSTPATMAVRHGDGNWSEWLPYSTTLSQMIPIMEGERETWLKLRTRAGIEGAPVSCRYFVIYPPSQLVVAAADGNGISLAWVSYPCDSNRVWLDGKPVLDVIPSVPDQISFTATVGLAEGVIPGRLHTLEVTRILDGVDSPASNSVQAVVPEQDVVVSLIHPIDTSHGRDALKVYASITTKNGNPLTELGQNDFSLQESANARPFRKVPLRSVTPLRDTSEPLAIILVLDTSGSMYAAMDDLKAAAHSFAGILRPQDKLCLIQYASTAQVIAGFDDDETTVSDAIDRLVSNGGTQIENGLNLALEQFATEQPEGLPVILLLSDGWNNSGLLPPMSSAQAARNLHIPIFTIGLGINVDTLLMQDIANTTGAGKNNSGYLNAPSPLELTRLFESLLGRLLDSYVLEWASSADPAQQVDVQIEVEYDSPWGTFRDLFRDTYFCPSF